MSNNSKSQVRKTRPARAVQQPQQQAQSSSTTPAQKVDDELDAHKYRLIQARALMKEHGYEVEDEDTEEHTPD